MADWPNEAPTHSLAAHDNGDGAVRKNGYTHQVNTIRIDAEATSLSIRHADPGNNPALREFGCGLGI
jgi:hypothetical protein